MEKLLSCQVRTGAAVAFALLFAAAATLSAPAAGNKPTPALEEFQKTFAGIKDYQFQIVTHETTDDGKHAEDRVYLFRYRKPSDAQIMAQQGRDKGGAATWHGGDTVSGHHGGFLSGIHLTKSIHDRDTTSLRGDILTSDAYDTELQHFAETAGTLAEAAGPDRRPSDDRRNVGGLRPQSERERFEGRPISFELEPSSARPRSVRRLAAGENREVQGDQDQHRSEG